MSRISKSHIAIVLAGAGVIAGLGGALAQQDKYSVKVPNGLGFSDFRGYERWQTIAVSQVDSLGLIEVIVGDPAMVAAYQAGIPGNGKPFPAGVRMAKIHWKAVKSPDAPAPTTIPGVLDDVDMAMAGVMPSSTGMPPAAASSRSAPAPNAAPPVMPSPK